MENLFRGLCVDSSIEGNETRFINSVTKSTPENVCFFISIYIFLNVHVTKQNWTAGVVTWYVSYTFMSDDAKLQHKYQK